MRRRCVGDHDRIVTETQPDRAALPTVDEILADLTDDDIDVAGGLECTRQLAALVLGTGAYEA